MRKISALLVIGILLLAGLAGATDPAPIKGVYVDGMTLVGVNSPRAVNVYVLVAATGQTVTVPATAAYCLPSCTADTWFLWGGTSTVTVPAANVTDGTGAELNPGAIRDIRGVSTIGIVSAVAGTCSIAWWY